MSWKNLKFTSSLAGLALATLALSPANSAVFNGGPVVNEPIVEFIAANQSGKKQLQRLLRAHSRLSNPITQKVRDATGDPNIVVFDRRGGNYDDIYQCSYITYRGKRALTCD